MPQGTWMPTSLNGVPTICLKEAILQVAPAIFEKFAGRELVFTLRTRAEGGEIELFFRRIYPSNQGSCATLSTRLY